MIASLQRIVRTAEKVIGAPLPSIEDIYNSRLTRKALRITADPTVSSRCCLKEEDCVVYVPGPVD